MFPTAKEFKPWEFIKSDTNSTNVVFPLVPVTPIIGVSNLRSRTNISISVIRFIFFDLIFNRRGCVGLIPGEIIISSNSSNLVSSNFWFFGISISLELILR